jgi:hypothetical protein
MIINDDNDDVNAFVDDKFVIVSVDAGDLTDIVGDKGTPFLQTLNEYDIKKHDPIMRLRRASQQCCSSKKWSKRGTGRGKTHVANKNSTIR